MSLRVSRKRSSRVLASAMAMLRMSMWLGHVASPAFRRISSSRFSSGAGWHSTKVCCEMTRKPLPKQHEKKNQLFVGNKLSELGGSSYFGIAGLLLLVFCVLMFRGVELAVWVYA